MFQMFEPWTLVLFYWIMVGESLDYESITSGVAPHARLRSLANHMFSPMRFPLFETTKFVSYLHMKFTFSYVMSESESTK